MKGTIKRIIDGHDDMLVALDDGELITVDISDQVGVDFVYNEQIDPEEKKKWIEFTLSVADESEWFVECFPGDRITLECVGGETYKVTNLLVSKTDLRLKCKNLPIVIET